MRIEAEGGHGTNGGSGGIIILAGGFNIPDEQLSVAGGASTNKNLTDDSGCSNGAAGTTYFITNDNTTRLLVDNKGRPTPKQTVLVAPEATNQMKPQLAHNVMVAGNSFVLVWTAW